MALTDNIISYYKLDESSGGASDSVGSNTLTNSNVTYGTGKINNGAVFNGSTSKFTDSSIVSGTSAFSISMWLKTTSVSRTIFAKRDTAAGSGIIFCLINASGYPIFSDFNGSAFGFNELTKNTNICDGNWHHLVIAINSGHTSGKMYVDGVAGTSQTPTGVSWNTNPFTLGASNVDGPGSFFNGTMDEIGIWQKELSASEVTTLYNSGAGLQYPFATTQNTGFLNFF